MTFDDLTKLPEPLAALERRIAALEKENANRAGSRPAEVPVGTDPRIANKKIREILRNLYRGYTGLEVDAPVTQFTNITDIVFLMKDGAIQHMNLVDD